MSKRDVRLYLTDILDCIDRIERYTAGFSYENFVENEMVIDAVSRTSTIQRHKGWLTWLYKASVPKRKLKDEMG